MPIKILQISTSDFGGGAEGTAYELYQYFAKAGCISKMAVGRKYRHDPNILEFPRPKIGTFPGNLIQKLAEFCRSCEPRHPAFRRLSRILERCADPLRRKEWLQGIEEFHFPGTEVLLDNPQFQADLIHCHNLHGYYFDLSVLPQLSRKIPVVLNLHDTWLLTGHCAYFMDCNAWRNGCGNCPNLSTYPTCRKDRTGENWQRKAEIFKNSRLYVTAPSAWLLNLAKESMLQAKEYRLIPNSIDCNIFRPAENPVALRKSLNLPENRPVVLFCAAAPSSIFKDPKTMAEAVQLLGEANPEICFVCIGKRMGLTPPHSPVRAQIRQIPFIREPALLAKYYQSADVFVHTAKAEVFGKTITEAMACGTPVVATNVGGIPEQLLHGKTGFLVPPASPEAIAMRVQQILNSDGDTRKILRENAAKQGAKYPLQAQGDALLQWYQEILHSFPVGTKDSPYSRTITG